MSVPLIQKRSFEQFAPADLAPSFYPKSMIDDSLVPKLAVSHLLSKLSSDFPDLPESVLLKELGISPEGARGPLHQQTKGGVEEVCQIKDARSDQMHTEEELSHRPELNKFSFEKQKNPEQLAIQQRSFNELANDNIKICQSNIDRSSIESFREQIFEANQRRQENQKRVVNDAFQKKSSFSRIILQRLKTCSNETAALEILNGALESYESLVESTRNEKIKRILEENEILKKAFGLQKKILEEKEKEKKKALKKVSEAEEYVQALKNANSVLLVKVRDLEAGSLKRGLRHDVF